MYREAEEIRAASTPGRYEGLDAFDAWLCEHALSDASWWDEDAGSAIDWHYWGARIGKRVILIDSPGFHYVTRYASEDDAVRAFAETFADWHAWQEIEALYGREIDATEISARARELLAEEGTHLFCDESELIGEAVSVRGYSGVAFRVDAYNAPTDEIHAHMVGDDREFTFSTDDATVISEDDYCPTCGQVGCGWH
jgi:hypothetical protein